jgi:[protein-PII] uridylyltransferase
MNIVEAEAYGNAAGVALEIIRFSDPLGTLELNPGEKSRLEWSIGCVVKGAIQVDDLLKRRRPLRNSASGPRVPPVARFNNQASATSTLLEFVGEDRPGLLYDLTTRLAEASCNIELVLADTEGRKAVDVFYITKDKNKLDPAVQQSLQVALAAAGAPMPEEHG